MKWVFVVSSPFHQKFVEDLCAQYTEFERSDVYRVPERKLEQQLWYALYFLFLCIIYRWKGRSIVVPRSGAFFIRIPVVLGLIRYFMSDGYSDSVELPRPRIVSSAVEKMKLNFVSSLIKARETGEPSYIVDYSVPKKKKYRVLVIGGVSPIALSAALLEDSLVFYKRHPKNKFGNEDWIELDFDICRMDYSLYDRVYCYSPTVKLELAEIVNATNINTEIHDCT